MSILETILADVRRRDTENPVVVFDLDSTLFSTRHRTFSILSEAASQFERLRPALAKLDADSLDWEFWNDLRAAGVDDPEVLRSVREFWQQRFFTSQYLVHDRPTPGAVEFATAVFRAGAVVCYLTGRDRPLMGDGTVAALRQYGFPFDDPRVCLILKADAEQSDEDHKRSAIARVRSLGPVVAAFDNEPEFVNLFADEFPGARVVLYESIHSPTKTVVYAEIPRISSFVVNGT